MLEQHLLPNLSTRPLDADPWRGLTVRAKNTLRRLGYTDSDLPASLDLRAIGSLSGVGIGVVTELRAFAKTNGIALEREHVETSTRRAIRLSARATNMLKRAGLDPETPEAWTAESLEHVPGIGTKTLGEILQVLEWFEMTGGSYSVSADPPAIGLEADFASGFACLSVRAQNVLKREHLSDLERLCSFPPEYIADLRGIGAKTVAEIQSFQREFQARRGVAPGLENTAPTLSGSYDEWENLPPEAHLDVFDAILLAVPRRKHALLASSVSGLNDLVRFSQNTHDRELSRLLKRALGIAVKAADSLEGSSDLFVRTVALLNLRPPGAPDGVDVTGVLGDRLIRVLGARPRVVRAFWQRYIAEERTSLEEIGEALCLTRERSRQILNEAIKDIQQYPGFIHWAIAESKRIVQERRGCCSEGELQAELVGGSISRRRTRLLDLLAKSPEWSELGLSREDGLVITADGANSLEEVSRLVFDVAVGAADENWGAGLWSAKLEDVVYGVERQMAAASGASNERISPSLVLRAVHAIPDLLRSHGNTIYSRLLWQLRHGKVTECIDAVLLSARRPLHHSEIAQEFHRWRGEGRGNPRGAVERFPDALLWDRGTYVHRLCVHIPYQLLREISEEIERRLELDVPFISVAGVFTDYEGELIKAGIPTRHALYGSLKYAHGNRFDVSEYPYIRRLSDEFERQPVSLVLESFVRESGGFVSRSALSDYMIQVLGVNSSLVSVHLYSIPNILIGDSGVIHSDNLPLDRQLTQALVDHVIEYARQEGQVSVHSILRNRRVACIRLGLDEPKLLHSVLRFYGDGMLCGEYPNLGETGSADGTKSTRDLLASYVREKQGTCSLAELRKVFVDGKGHNERSLLSVWGDSRIVRFAEGTLVHLDSMGWNAERDRSLEDLAISEYLSAKRRGALHVRISDLIDSREGDLPEIGNLPWTGVLLAHLLRRLNSITVIGTSQDAYVMTDNPEGILCLDDIAALLLENVHSGACDIDSFEEQLRSEGLIRTSLKKSMLGRCSKVVIDRDCVRLRRLS